MAKTVLDGIRTNTWAKLSFADPEFELRRLRGMQIALAPLAGPAKVKNLRTNKLNWARQRREAAIFTYGVRTCVLKRPAFYAMCEEGDLDFVVSWNQHDTQHFAPVQLKEVVPSSTNPKATLESALHKLSKYTDSSDLIVAIHLNQRGRTNFRSLTVPSINIAELWIFGASRPDQSRWFLVGDLLRQAEYHEFDHPS